MKRLARIVLFVAASLGLCEPARSGAREAASARPDIIFIMADDMGAADLSRDGAQGYQTPVLDRLAAEGVRFTQAYANSAVCSPTRTALLTGRYQYRFKAGLAEPNVKFPPGDELPLGTPTIASLLHQAGYRTALIGKWHVSRVPEFSPLRYGYNHFFGVAGGAADYFRHGYVSTTGGRSELYDDDRVRERDGYLTDILADEAVQFIEADDRRPLFLSLHFTAPHWPWEGPNDREHSARLTQMSDLAGGSLETYGRMMVAMDAAIGRVLAAIESRGRSRNTLVVFTSDNGGERYSNNWPFTGYKTELLEGGIRVPLFIRWPERIKPGSVSSQVTISMDMVPTLLAAAGAPPAPETDGMDILPQAAGLANPVSRALYWRYNTADQQALRDGDWKYLRIGSKEALFDIARDPRERADLKDVHPGILAALKAEWATWNREMLPYPAASQGEGTTRTYIDRYAPGVARREAVE